MPTVRFVSHDGETNLTREVQAAFGQPAVTITVPGAGVVESYGPKSRAPKLPEYEVALDTVKTELLDKVKEPWILAVWNGDGVEVLDREDLEDALKEERGVMPVQLRQVTEQEHRVLDASKAYFSPESSLKRIEDSVNAPIALTGTVGTFVGVGGFVAIDDSIQRNWPVFVSVGAMAAAVALALFARYGLKTSKINLNRIDLVQKTLGSVQTRKGARFTYVSLFLLVLALVIAPLAAFPKKDPPSSATISSPGGAKVGTGAKVKIKVAWDDLADKAARVRAVVTQGAFSQEHYENASSGKGDLTFDEDLPSTEDYTVTTEAVDGAGQPFGKGFLRTFSVP